MKTLSWLIKKFYIGRKAYALNEYRYYADPKKLDYTPFYRIEKVIINDITFSHDTAEYFVRDAITFLDWGDTTKNVFMTKRQAANYLINLQLTPTKY